MPRHIHPLAGASCLFVVSAVFITHAQTAATPPPNPADTASTIAYDVISIKPNHSGGNSSSSSSSESRLSATNISLKQLLQQVYAIKQNLISGIPDPIDSARFDIQAKVADPNPAILKKLSSDQTRLMLLPLLSDRFRLKTHIEVKTLPVYELVLAKGGSKCKPSKDQTTTDGDLTTDGSNTLVKISARKSTMASLAKAISNRVDRTVIDKTGLAGNFDFDLQWSREESPDPGGDAPPTIFTAIEEQLGLKLQPGKGPVDTLVVDHAEMPSEN
jgi:uncharacterized protein (TIGR03435 family)